MKKFNYNEEYNRRMEYINQSFQGDCKENEEITVDADTGWKTPEDIYIRYERVSNKTHISGSVHLSPALMCMLSDITVFCICSDILAGWRKNVSH